MNELQTTNATSLAKQPEFRDPLPMPWIEKLFGRMFALYGAKFADAWKGCDIDEVKSVWAEKLAGFHAMPNCIKTAIDACDDRPWPPNLPEFLQLCRDAARRLGTQQLALEEPRMSKDEARKRLQEIQAIINSRESDQQS